VKGGMNFGKDPERGCLEADMDALAKHLARLDPDETLILEGHFSHHFADWSIVLRLAPPRLKSRLEARGYSAEKIKENLEAEALDVILVEAVEFCDRVDEIDTTGKSTPEVAELVARVIQGRLKLAPGQVNWLDEFFG
jgi:adenylate kinase